MKSTPKRGFFGGESIKKRGLVFVGKRGSFLFSPFNVIKIK